MANYQSLVNQALREIPEYFPWDLEERLQSEEPPLLLDVREPGEFADLHIPGSINVPRGILEAAVDYGYEETEPALVEARQREVVIICRSGRRSALAAWTLRLLGFEQVYSLKTGVKGWNDYDQPLVDSQGNTVSPEWADQYFTPRLRPEQLPRAYLHPTDRQAA